MPSAASGILYFVQDGVVFHRELLQLVQGKNIPFLFQDHPKICIYFVITAQAGIYFCDKVRCKF